MQAATFFVRDMGNDVTRVEDLEVGTARPDRPGGKVTPALVANLGSLDLVCQVLDQLGWRDCAESLRLECWHLSDTYAQCYMWRD